MSDNPYKQKPMTEKSIKDRIKEGGCYCVRQWLLGDIDKLKAPKAKKAELWELANNNDWVNC